MVGADPARRVAQHVEGPTLLDRELPFGRGIATLDRAPTCLGRSSPAFASASRPGRPSAPARRIRRIAASGALLLALALVAAGCGGAPAADPSTAAPAPTPDASATGTTVAGATDPNTGLPVTTPAAPGAAGATTPATSTQEDVPGANEIAGSEAAGMAAVKISKLTPRDFAKAHCIRPIVIVLHQPGAIMDQELLGEARAAVASVSAKDVLTLVYTPREIKRSGDLLAKVGLLSSPGVSVINRGGAIQNFWPGYVDAALIRRSLELAAATKPCKVSNEDAGASAADPSLGAAAPSALANAATLVAGTGTPAAAGATPAPGAGDINSESGNAALKLLR